MWVVCAVAAPVVELTWRNADAAIEVSAPAGYDVAGEAPATLHLRWPEGSTRYETVGSELAAVRVPDLRGAAVDGSLSWTVCSKADGLCTTESWSIGGTVGDRRRGRLALAITTAPEAAPHPTVFNRDPQAAVDAAFAEARATGRAVLLDFSAVWCPPCNLLSAEVLHAATPPEALDGYVVVVVDVDHPGANPIKASYDVGGYPTVVAASADGAELSRVVGYPGRDAFVDWLGRATTSGDAADRAAGPDALSPERALEVAWSLLQDRRTDEASAFAARGADVDSALARRVRVSLTPGADDARWLLEHDRAHIYDWMGAAPALAEREPELARAIAEAAVAHLEGPPLADALYVYAEVTQQRWAYAAAASALRTALSGDPDADRGHLTWLAELTARNDLDAALALLDDARRRFPDEPTWDLTAARLLASADRPALRVEVAARAYATAWGDNKLRAALALAEAKGASGDAAGARAVIDEALATDAPDAELAVRAHRYRRALTEFRATLVP